MRHLSLFNQGTGKWYEMQDLQVTDILPQMITLSEAYIQASPPTHSVHVGKGRALAAYLLVQHETLNLQIIFILHI